jgi:hypothetical protein
MAGNNLKVHVRDNNTATLICPACGFVRHISAAKLLHARHTLSIRCRCQHVFTVLFDFRRHFRKPTSLPGTYVITSEGGVGGGIIHINNISRGGLGFTVSGLHRIEKGQELMIEFQLNDRKRTPLKKQAVVKSVQHNAIGCQFKDRTELERDLGFFLQS